MGILLTNAHRAAQDDVLSVRDVGRLLGSALEDGAINPAERKDLEKVRAELNDKMSPAARSALNRFLGLGDTFDANLAGKIFGISEEMADKLEMAGVRSARELLVSSRTPEARGALALKANISKLELTDFAERADLARVIGIGTKYAGLLEGAGVNNVTELSLQDPATLRRQLLDFMKTDAGKGIVLRCPSKAKLTDWIERSKALPAMLRYAGEEGPNFNKEAFDRLPDRGKAMLIWGHDVRLPDGSLFDADHLKVSVPRRKPRQITELIRGFEQSGFDGDFNSAHLAKIERVQLKNETVGYRLQFEVAGTSEEGYEGVEGPIETEGWVELALDSEGKLLDRTEDVWLADSGYEG